MISLITWYKIWFNSQPDTFSVSVICMWTGDRHAFGNKTANTEIQQLVYSDPFPPNQTCPLLSLSIFFLALVGLLILWNNIQEYIIHLLIPMPWKFSRTFMQLFSIQWSKCCQKWQTYYRKSQFVQNMHHFYGDLFVIFAVTFHCHCTEKCNMIILLTAERNNQQRRLSNWWQNFHLGELSL